jgi:arylsulfatase A-like enzyme
MKLPFLLYIAVSVLIPTALVKSDQPNIVFILCDDLGYGDVQCLNPEHGKIPTPAVDKLAAEGMVFTDAHSGSSVCTPTRYGLMTGRYSWRTRHQSGVVQGFAPNLIAADRPTVAGFLQSLGYHTGIIGKWHLNFQYLDPDSGKPLGKNTAKKGLAPVGSRIPDGPIQRGFHYFHGFHHARDMKGVIENDTVILHEDEINMLPRLTRKAVEYIEERATAKEQSPFFLYVPLGSPHTPILPTERWQGRSGLGAYADFVMQTDGSVGEILDAIQTHGLSDNTLVIFSSDNGCSKAADIPALARQGHRVSADYRGSKADLWDGGHRVPFIVRWPGKVAAGSTSDQTICLTDFFATLSELTGQALPAGSAEDSVSFLPAIFGKPIDSNRAGVVHHSISGHFGYRQGKWKLLLARGSGGWSSPNEKQAGAAAPAAQLYDMDIDPAETTNLYQSRPDVVKQLLNQLQADVFGGRSTPGTVSHNDIESINLWKSGVPKRGS